MAQGKENKSSSYNRKSFKHWVDADHDCQDTRAEILIARSETPVIFKKNNKRNKNCSVVSGKWNDFYYFEILSEAKNIDIDHVVPLKHAWETGAGSWTEEKRKEFANDFENLVITNKKYNRQKGPKTILEWMPVDRKYACKYMGQWMHIKRKYGLTISKTELQYQAMAKCDQ